MRKAIFVIAALCAVVALAAQRNWNGNGENTLWNTAANWDSVPGGSDSLAFRTADVGNRTATINGTYTYTGNIHMGVGSSAANPYIFESTDPANVLTIKDDTWLGYYEDGWFWIKSGTYVFNGTSGKNFHLGEGYKATHNFWMKVGDGASTVSVTTKGNAYVRGGSTFVADKATLDFTLSFEQNETASSYFTNTTMKAQYIRLFGQSSMMSSGSSLTVARDFNLAADKGSSCSFKSLSGTVNLTGSGYVLNVGSSENSTGVVEKEGGDWDCYYLRLGTGAGSTGTFTMNGGTLRARTFFQLGYGASSVGKFYLNGGTLKAKRVTNPNSTASTSLVIDGGTLQADSTNGAWVDSPIDVRIGENGGTIHTDGGNVIVSAAVNSVEDTAGAFTVTGGGSATFYATGNLTGAFTLGEGTELHWFDSDATVATYTLESLSLGAGSTLALDVDATGCDKIAVAESGISATAGNIVTFKLVVREMPEPGRVFPLLEMTAAEAMNCSIVAVTPVGAVLDVEKGWADGFLTYAITAKDFVWGDGPNGGGWKNDGAKWNVDGIASEWSDNNNAVFATAGDVATLDANVAAVALGFRADATVNAAEGSSAAITTPEVSVVSGVSATLNVPISSTFSKTGAGTLALGVSRSEPLTLAGGTLEMTGATVLDWTKLTFGAEPAKPVTLRLGPDATLASIPDLWYVGTQANITSTVVKTGGDWTIKNMYMASASSAVTAFVQEGGTLTFTSTVDIGKDASAVHAHLDIAGGTVYHSGYIHNGASSPGTMTVRSGAKYEVTSPQIYGLIVSGNVKGTLNVQGGEVLLTGPLNLCYRSGDAEVNVTDGGLLAITKVQLNAGTGSSGTAAITLDGGTLRANEGGAAFIPDNARLSLAVGANGGTIDVNGKVVVFGRPLSGAGGMTFKGGGTVMFTADNAYAGATTVEVGTGVVVPSLGSIAGGFSVTLPETQLADGVYTVVALTGSDAFSANVLNGLAAPEGGRYILSNDSKAILCIVGNPGFVWIGGSSGSLSDAANWANGLVPLNGDSCTIGSPAAADLTVGETFAAAYITFPAESGLVTISGERTFPDLVSIVNNSLWHHVLACPVDARTAMPDIPLGAADYLVFSGGIAVSAMPSVDHMRLAGEWNLDGDWTLPPDDAIIMPGSTVNVSGTLLNGYNLVISANATLRVANAIASLGAANKNRFLYKNDGMFIVSGEIMDTIHSDSSTGYSIAGFFANGNNNAVTRVNGLVHSASTKNGHQFRLSNSGNNAINTIVLGSGGLSFKDNLRVNSACYPYFQVDSGKPVVLASSADWSISNNTAKENGVTLELGGPVTIDTSDYDDRTVAHTVRALGKIGNAGSVTVKGCGRMTFERATTDFAGGLYVQDTATAAIYPGCASTRCGISVGSGATLEIPVSGTVEPGGNLTLADGACLAFNFTEKTPPLLDVSAKDVALGGTIVVKVSAVGETRANKGANALTAGGKFANATVSLAPGAPKWVRKVSVVDGEIVLDAKGRSTVLFFR